MSVLHKSCGSLFQIVRPHMEAAASKSGRPHTWHTAHTAAELTLCTRTPATWPDLYEASYNNFLPVVLQFLSRHRDSHRWAVSFLVGFCLTSHSMQMDRLLYFPHYNTKTYGRRAFSYAGPHSRNLLPENMQKSTSIAILERSLQTVLFEQIAHSAH